MKKVTFTKKWAVALLALFGISLISAGVFASATITLNGNTPVNLGAGSIGVEVCDSSATISTDQTYDAGDQRFELTTVTLSGINTSNTCNGKTLSLAFKTNSGTKSTTWAVVNNQTTYVYGFEGIDTAGAGITTIAVSAQ
jgi:hypothetical protein